jgi:hypothetical protein
MSFGLQLLGLRGGTAGQRFEQAAIAANHAPVGRDAGLPGLDLLRRGFGNHANVDARNQRAGDVGSSCAGQLFAQLGQRQQFPRGTLRIIASTSRGLGISIFPRPKRFCIR